MSAGASDSVHPDDRGGARSTGRPEGKRAREARAKVIAFDKISASGVNVTNVRHAAVAGDGVLVTVEVYITRDQMERGS